jgi:hypothetical protein
MATFVVFDIAKLGMGRALVNLSATYRAAPWSGATPSIDTSTMASLTAGMTVANLSASGQTAAVGSAGRQLAPPGDGALSAQWTKTADGVIKFDLSDIAFTASSGANITANHVIIWRSGTTLPLGYAELSTGTIVASQINVQWPAEGLFETSDNV